MPHVTAGRINVVAGLFFMAAFMAYGFFLIYMRDFAPGKEAWIAAYTEGDHFQSRLAHVHGNLFAFLNVVIGWLLMQFRFAGMLAKTASWAGLGGMLMPLGILAETLFGAPPLFVLIGAVSMIVAVLALAFAFVGVSATGRRQ